MLMTVAELRQFMDTDAKEQVLEAMLQALELSIRAYTNNNFQKRSFRAVAVAIGENTLMAKEPIPFRVGDTLQITESDLMQDQLVTVAQIADGTITVNETLSDESGVVITKVEYPADVKMGVANLMKWELERRDKIGVASESISRHSVTYVDMTKENSIMGYPAALLGFLKPYKKARFGRGINA